jgi:hypothetical protein
MEGVDDELTADVGLAAGVAADAHPIIRMILPVADRAGIAFLGRRLLVLPLVRQRGNREEDDAHSCQKCIEFAHG